MINLVRTEDIWKARGHFMQVIDDVYDFEIFVGHPNLLPVISGNHHSCHNVSEFTARRVAMLCGPHYRAIIKAWVIVRDQKLS